MRLSKNRRAIGTLGIILIILLVVAAVVAVAVGIAAFFFLASRPPYPSMTVIGSGKLATEENELSDFKIVEVGSAFKVEISQSDAYSVSIIADENLFDYIRVSKNGETLAIGLKPGYDYQSLTLSAEITMPELYELRLSGATRGTVNGFSSSHEFTLDLSGASSLDMVDMSAGDIEVTLSGASLVTGSIKGSGDARFTLSGASRVRVEGAADNLYIQASGASDLELSDFPVHNADANLSGASRAAVNLDGRLDADLSGGSHLIYIGEPTMGDINTSGGSTISKK